MSQSPMTAFAWETGSSVAVASLKNVENDLYAYTKPLQLYPLVQPVEAFPVRDLAGDGFERGDGMVDHLWQFAALPLTAFYYVLDTYLTTGGVLVSAKEMTIYSLRRAPSTYQRYNAFLCLPRLNEDYTIDGGRAMNVRYRFTDLIVR